MTMKILNAKSWASWLASHHAHVILNLCGNYKYSYVYMGSKCLHNYGIMQLHNLAIPTDTQHLNYTSVAIYFSSLIYSIRLLFNAMQSTISCIAIYVLSLYSYIPVHKINTHTKNNVKMHANCSDTFIPNKPLTSYALFLYLAKLIS